MKLLPINLQSRFLAQYELNRYFDSNSTEELILLLNNLAKNRILTYDVILSKRYIEREDARREFPLGGRVSATMETYGVLNNYSRYGIGALHSKIRQEQPLSTAEINKAVLKLPEQDKQEFLQIAVTVTDIEKFRLCLHDNIPISEHHQDVVVEYKGLIVTGDNVEYRGNRLNLGFQEKQTLLVFMRNAGGLCTKDDFYDGYASIFNDKDYPNLDDTLRKLISAVHKKLRIAIGKRCIVNTPREGWTLSL